jgi:ABC-type ATPase involved in cell division
MALIEFDKVTKEYETGYFALDGVSFKVEPGEFVFLIASFPCAKIKTSMLLKLFESRSIC